MASASPKATRTATQTPGRGRGRGRPRVYSRSSSTTSAVRKTPVSMPKIVETTPTARRRAVYQNGYRPGGAGGGGRYIHPDTGQEIPATVYRQIMKSGDRMDTPGTVTRTVRRPPPPPPQAVGSDGVYKPREERGYAEFHPGLDITQPLLILRAEDVDGENYKPTTLPETKSVKIIDIKEEEDVKKDLGVTESTKEGIPGVMLNRESVLSEGSSRLGLSPEESTSGASKPDRQSAQSPVSPPSNDLPTIADSNNEPVTTISHALGDLPVLPGSIDGGLAGLNGVTIDSSIAVLTPPTIPISESLSVPLDRSLAPDSQTGAAQTHTPAATPVEGHLKDDATLVTPTPPPASSAGQIPGISPTKRGLSDVPTLASLRAHRSTAGKPPPRPVPPPTTRKPRQPNQYTAYRDEELYLRAPSYRKIPASTHAVGSHPAFSNKEARGFANIRSSNTAKSISDQMKSVGYQTSSHFDCSETLFRDQPDPGIDEELGIVDMDLVEYDMDEQDDQWLRTYNSHRNVKGYNDISNEIFELVMTKTEKEWVNLERKMPKVQAKPHGIGMPNRRRSGRAGEDDDDEGAEDSKCAICDDGECENANAIVFCDGCNLAVHQECYGVPYIPEGQWHCRRCQQIPRQIANCVFCPNTDGAFKQTTTNRWAHLLCAIWIPEVRLANPAFMEPVEGVDHVPKSRWKLNCYICKQKMGACIQCSNRNCFLAFHVTCGRRARLHMKMKNTSGPGAQLESSGLKALCHKHVPADWREENDVDAATDDAMEFYATTFTGRDWGDSQAAAVTRPISIMEDAAHSMAPRVNNKLGDKRKLTAEQQKNIWKLPSGAPVIPRILLNVVIASLARFNIAHVEQFAADACKYWTLKREARRGASLVRRLQVQADSNSFTSLEVIRKNYPAMGRVQGEKRLERRKDFAGDLEHDLIGLIGIVKAVKHKEDVRIQEVEMLKSYVDAMYFPELPLMRDVLRQAEKLDKNNVFGHGFRLIKDRLENRLYPSVSAFGLDVRSVLRSSPSEPRLDFDIRISGYVPPAVSSNLPPFDQEDSAFIATEILDALKGPFETAMTNEKEIWIQERSVKKARLLEQMNGALSDASGSVNGTSIPNSPAAEQLCKEASPEKLKPFADILPIQLPEGRTILGKVSATLAKEMLVGSGDKARPPWYVKDYRPTGMDIDSEPMDLDSSTVDTIRAGSTQVDDLSSRLSLAVPEVNGVSRVSQANAPHPYTDEDEDMEDAPGEIDEDFLPPPAPMQLVTETAPDTSYQYRIHSDLHDEDAEGELDDEIPMNMIPPPINVVNPTPILPEVDSGTESNLYDDNDLLGGYREEDLPSPLGLVDGMAASPGGDRSIMSMNVGPMLDIPYSSQPHPTSPTGRLAMVDLPDPPPNRSIPDKMDLEAMTNTSVLSDYPESMDENGVYDSKPADGEDGREDNDDDGDEHGANFGTSPGRKSRRGAQFQRQSNGRFGKPAPERSLRKRKKR